MPLLDTPWSLLIVVVMVWALAGGRGRGDTWCWPVELALAVVFGLAGGLIGALWLASFSMPDAQVIGSPDFVEYCRATDAVIVDAWGPFNGNRSRVAAALPAAVGSVVGVLNGLLGGAILSLCLICGGAFLWARAAHSRLAGAAAALGMGSVASVALLGRTLTFYPEITAALVMAMAGAMVALRRRTAAAIAVGSAGVGLALLVDARGLIWALPGLGLTLVAALVGPRLRDLPRGLPLRLVCLAVPLWLSWTAAPWAYVPGARSVEGHADVYAELQQRGYQLPPRPPLEGPESRFIWGQTNPLHVHRTLRHLASQSALVPDRLRSAPHTRHAWQARVAPWVAPVVAGLFLAALGLRRRPLLFLGLLGTCLPFAASVDSAVVLKGGHPRFVGSALPFVAVVVGVGLGVLAGGMGRGRGPRDRGRWGLWRLVVMAGAMGAAVVGALPTYLSPVAGWRTPVPPYDREVVRARALADGTGELGVDPTAPECATAINRVPGDGGWLDRLP